MKNLKVLSAIAVVAAVVVLIAAGRAQDAQAEGRAQFKPTASLQEVMTEIIDPNIDYVWNSVATVSTKKGIEERSPKTDEDWTRVRQHALAVLEASNLLLIEGRPIARPGASTSAHQVELGPQEIQKAIVEHRADYVQHVHALHAAVTRSIAAIDARNVDDLIQYGSAIDQVCESCHKQFWYPNDKRPTSVPAIQN